MATENVQTATVQTGTVQTENVQTFTDANFDEIVIKAPLPVLVDFWAPWCGPCKRLGPTVEALANDYAGKVTIGKLNVDDNPDTAFKYQIRGIPALLLFKGGQVVESIVGLAPKEELKRAIDPHIEQGAEKGQPERATLESETPKVKRA
jgi:thioredoxin 1